jgi:pSer/pThr/pTyr-binding forkhead associated (FHA) protein
MIPAASSLPSQAQDCPTVILDALPRVGPKARRHAVGADAPPPGRYLVLEDGPHRELLPIGEGAIHLGRGFSADIELDDQSVSRRHAILHVRGRSARILDDRSANGTFVNGVRVSESALSDGDVIVLGRVVVTFRDIPA